MCACKCELRASLPHDLRNLATTGSSATYYYYLGPHFSGQSCDLQLSRRAAQQPSSRRAASVLKLLSIRWAARKRSDRKRIPTSCESAYTRAAAATDASERAQQRKTSGSVSLRQLLAASPLPLPLSLARSLPPLPFAGACQMPINYSPL